MTAAHALTRPEQQGKFEVTVYQLGWRLGGKGASGRGPNGRIEEHGLHIWMGFYENAFRLMRSVYEEAARDPATCPIVDWKEAFFPSAHIGLATSRDPDSEWAVWSTLFPPLPGQPGDPLENDAANPFALAGYLTRTAGMMRTLFEMAYRGNKPFPPDSDGAFTLSDVLTSAQQLSRIALGAVEVVLGVVENQLLTLGRLLKLDPTGSRAGKIISDLGRALLGGMNMLRPTPSSDPVRTHASEVLEVIIASLVGIFGRGIILDPRGLDALDEFDFIQWLQSNGMSDRGAKSPFLLGLYSLMFAYEGGDPQRPRVAGGQALRGVLRMFFTYRGALFWKMTAGMGDVIFAPLYEVLRNRGVKFEFFHKLRNVTLAPTGDHVSALEFDVQAEARDGEYRPLVDVRGLPSWPSQPDFDQLVNGDALARDGVRFESHWDDTRARTKTLALGADFDFVVLGVGGGALEHVAPELLAHDTRWALMAKNNATIATQALQLWTRQPMTDLGWNRGSITMTAFVPPFDTWSDMSHLVPAESWPDGHGLEAIAYFCNVIDDRHVHRCGPPGPAFQNRINAFVGDGAHGFVTKDLPRLWPGLADRNGMRWETIADTYWVGNVNPTDRYVQSLPGTTKYRISPLDRTFDNLTVAGDWTSCGMSFGCVESAVMSGLLASHALSGYPALESIIGYDHP